MPTFGDSTVSVCTPVYNGSDYIEESIRSILSQTYTNFKLIVCDNCSTDNTEEIVRSFSDPRITYSRNQTNLGLVGNANRCLELADGNYVHILHHDDIMLPENLERKVRVLDEHPSVGFVHSNVGFIDQEGAHLDLTKFDAGNDYIENGRLFFEKYILKMPVGASIFIGAVMARRECYLKLGGFNPTLINVNDSEMWMRILLHYDVACIGERLVNYRLHNMMTSSAINDEQGLNIPGLQEHFLGCKIVLEKYPDRIPNWKQINEKVATAFSLRAVTRGIGMLRKGDIRQSISYFKIAGQFDPLIVSRKSLWEFMMSLLLKNIRKLKN
jgi:glycosyltransferase involved in cell wall biosynthesis